MTDVAVLGAGAGGLASAVELAGAGHRVRLWNRNPATLSACRDGRIRHHGRLGDGTATIPVVTTDLNEVLAGADAAMVCLPALAHGALFAELAEADCRIPVVLNPAHTGGALRFREAFRRRAKCVPPVAELSTLAYVARRRPDGSVDITGRAQRLRCAVLPGGEPAYEVAAGFYPAVVRASDVLETSLSNVNLVLHPPGAVLAAAWVEATGGDFTFYVDAMTPGVTRVMKDLDAERLAVAAAFGHQLPAIAEEMSLLGTAAPEAARAGDTRTAIRDGEANRDIKAPDSLQHRYYVEDFPFAVVPFLALAAAAGVQAPTALALLAIAESLTGLDLNAAGLRAGDLGVSGLDVAGILELVRS